jgi:uncharacterized protein (DUF1499 family)
MRLQRMPVALKMLTLILAIVVAGAALLFIAGRLGWLAGTPPADVGVRDGRLKPPSATRNSVSSQASLYPAAPQRRYAEIAPLRCEGDPVSAMVRLERVLGTMPGAKIVAVRPDYLYAQFTTRWLRFVDDVEFMAAPDEGVIHLRSASRLGREDLGTNRRRVEAIRAACGELR